MVIDRQNPNQPGIRAHHFSRFKTASIGIPYPDGSYATAAGSCN